MDKKTQESFRKEGKIYAAALLVISETMRDFGCHADGCAAAIVARLARNEPPLFICTADQMRDEE